MAQTVSPFPTQDESLPGEEHPRKLNTTESGHSTPPEMQALRLGDWIFDPSLNRLRGDAGDVRLEPKVASLLRLLVEHAGRVVSKEEIVGTVWEGRFIADSALTRTMAELRRGLGDDAHHPRYIETISKKGYRLLIRPEAADEQAPAAARKRLPKSLLLGVTLVATFVIVAAVMVSRGRTGSAPPIDAPVVSSVIVLPLEDLSPEREGEYFASSMTEALTTDLARLGAFKVISRRSIEQYREASGSLVGIAEEFGADATVEGTVVRADDRVRIDVQLTDAATETHLWAESYERPFVDVLTLQREVARAIAGALSSSVASGFEGTPSAAEPRKVDPQAHDLYLKGRHALQSTARHGPNAAAAHFERVLEIDPTFALAYAGLADYYSLLTLYDYLKPHDGFPEARSAALKALEIDPGLGEAHAALAHVEFMFDWDWKNADDGFRRALELNPSNADVRRAYSFFLTCMGRFEEAEQQARFELELDPLNSRHHLGWVLFNARRHEESLAELEAGRALKGNRKGPSTVDGWNYALLGRYDESVEALEAIVFAKGRSDPPMLGVLGWAYGTAGRFDEARAMLQRIEQQPDSDRGNDLYPRVLVTTGLGEVENALDLLEQAVLQRSPNAVFLKVEPFLDPLRDHPRYQRLLASTALAD